MNSQKKMKVIIKFKDQKKKIKKKLNAHLVQNNKIIILKIKENKKNIIFD